jgi:predicted nucleic acid-binding protein
MSGNRVFVDTNVLVYAYDRDAGRKRDIARDVLAGLWKASGGILSVQILQEFFVTVTKKIAKPLSAAAAREIVEDYLSWEVLPNDGESVLAAIDIHAAEKISFWDALVIAAAERGGADILLSEDLANGRRFDDIMVRNPFASA